MSLESTIKEPIHFFENFFLFDGYHILKREFFENWQLANELNPGEVFLNETDEFIVHCFNTDEFNHSIPTKVFFIDELKITFSKEVQKSKRNINKGAKTLSYKDISPLFYLEEVKKTIKVFISQGTALLNKYPQCRKYLDMLITFIDLMAKKYQPYTTEFEDSKEKVLTIEQNSKKSNFPIHNKKGSIHQPPFFNITKLSDKFFNSLFILLNSNGIIDISGTFEEEANKFYYLFKSPNPWNGDYSIQFSVNNLEVALIFDELKNYIKNLTPTNIEKCKCFFKISNETKSPFLRGDLFTALGKAKRKIKENPDWIRPEIQLVIDEIKKLAKKYRRSLS